ncbi:Protein of unknown function (DUF501) [Seminavis robusta]|uniref:Uncharacterized protein n=1 Tax=Seminavis robusta TaxID=568900 RepID=A0A9N8E898_9STRA|nr:Protein of unknown function (DUF501) [Seminavis robusta]|eukprot:Sro730_g194020.1 Protein of unknown function (DUF501) (428) ;mRNA; r:23665-24948
MSCLTKASETEVTSQTVLKNDHDDAVNPPKKKNSKDNPLFQSPLAGQRRGLGRSARRRRKKLIETLRAEEQLLKQDGTSTTTNTNTSVIATDRHRIWPGVEERRRLLQSNTDGDYWGSDAPRLVAQLAFIPGNAIRICARVSTVPFLQTHRTVGEEPVVLQLYPLAVRDDDDAANSKFKRRKRKRQKQPQTDDKTNDDSATEQSETKMPENAKGGDTILDLSQQSKDSTKRDPDTKNLQSNPPTKDDDNKQLEEDDFVVEPFPTLYWLTHPLLRTMVSKLELQGTGRRLEQRLQNDPHALEAMTRAHHGYGQERYDLLTPTDIAYIETRKWQRAFDPRQRGVAGIRNHAAVKCLHAHVAHYLSGGQGSSDNVIGKWVMEEIMEQQQQQQQQSLPKEKHATESIMDEDTGVGTKHDDEEEKVQGDAKA